MKRKYHILVGLTVGIVLSLSSCNPDCKEVTIQKVDWKTRYVNYYIEKDTIEEVGRYVDTLVSYSIEEHRTVHEYKKDASGNTKGCSANHYITLRNNNKSYSNAFAIQLTGMEYKESTGKWSDISPKTSYIRIAPESTYTFLISHSSWWRNESYGYNEGNVSITILQKPSYEYVTTKQIKQIRQKKVKRIDNLIYSDTIVNDCECDVDLLKEKYATIKETFDRLKKEHLIITE